MRRDCRVALAALGVVAALAEPARADRSLLFHTDGGYENAAYWQYGGVVPPDFGALAEHYSGEGLVDSLVVDLTRDYPIDAPYADLYIWAHDAGFPGAVIGQRLDVPMGGIPVYPLFTRKTLPFDSAVDVPSEWWIGLWGQWPGGTLMFALGIDEAGSETTAATKVAAGQEWPSGWQPLNVVWPNARHLSIGAWFEPALPTSTRSSSWGRVKSLYASKR